MRAPDEEINEKVANAAKILDLEQHLDRKPANLSGGQRQRIAMGHAIVRNPAAVQPRREAPRPDRPHPAAL